jgi:phosphatidylglycerol lysyltransferase
MEALLLKYGYFILFFGVLLEGEAFLVTGAILASRGMFSLPGVIVLSTLANSVANQFYYLAARARGREWLEARYGQDKRYQRITGLVEKHGPWLLLASRYMYGLRLWICAACGALGMAATRFTILSVLSSALWVAPTAIVAFYAGNSVLRFLHRAHRYGPWIVVGLVVVVATVFALRHLRRSIADRDLRLSDFHALAPLVIALMGLLNIVTGILPRSRPILLFERAVPIGVAQMSRVLVLFAGLALLQVALGLARRRSVAWYVASAALAVSLVSHLGRGFDLPQSILAGALLLYLVSFRKRFYAPGPPERPRLALAMAPVLAGLVLLYGAVGLARNANRFSWEGPVAPWSEAFREGVLMRRPGVAPMSLWAQSFQGSIWTAGFIARAYLLFLLLATMARGGLDVAPALLADIARRHGRRSLASMALRADKRHVLLLGERAFVGYAGSGSVAFSCGDPVCASEDAALAAREFFAELDERGWTPCVFEAAEDRVEVYKAMGLVRLKITEEAIVDLASFGTAGARMGRLRNALNHARAAGLRVDRYHREQAREPGLDEQLEEISEGWLRERGLGERGFAFGRFSLDGLLRVPLFVCRSRERVEGFCTWSPYWGGRGALLDLLRRRTAPPKGAVDLLLFESLVALRHDGFDEASLSTVPLGGSGERGEHLQRGEALLFENLNRLYGYRDLRRFKEKFRPRWEARYLVFPEGADLRRVATALAGIHGAGRVRDLLLNR